MSCPGQVAQLAGVSSRWARASGLIPGQNTHKSQPVNACMSGTRIWCSLSRFLSQINSNKTTQCLNVLDKLKPWLERHDPFLTACACLCRAQGWLSISHSQVSGRPLLLGFKKQLIKKKKKKTHLSELYKVICRAKIEILHTYWEEKHTAAFIFLLLLHIRWVWGNLS